MAQLSLSKKERRRATGISGSRARRVKLEAALGPPNHMGGSLDQGPFSGPFCKGALLYLVSKKGGPLVWRTTHMLRFNRRGFRASVLEDSGFWGLWGRRAPSS